MGQGGHLPGTPQGIWPVGSPDATTPWLGSGLRALLPSGGTLETTTGEPIQISISPLRPRLAPSALHLSPSFPRVFGGVSAPHWLPCRPLVLRAPAHPGRALTSGTGKPFRVLPGVQPKGRESRSSYSAGSQRASALLAAPRAGFLLKPSKTRAQPRPGRCGLGFSAKPVEPGAAAVGAFRGKRGAEERPLECGVSELRPP